MKVSTLDKICCFLSELLGTGLLVFLGCMGCIRNEIFHNNHLQMVFNFGLVVMICVQTFGCVSGAHINPSVTIAAYFYDMVSLSMAFIYFAGQMFGAFIGYGLLLVLVPQSTVYVEGEPHALCVTAPHPSITGPQAVAIEFIITAVLVAVCCAVWDPRNLKYHDSVTIRFGLTITCLACTAGPFTGGSMNPARSFAPSLWNWDFTRQWIYWVGPISASIITSILYKAVFRRELPEEKPINKLRAMEEVPLS